MSGDALALGRRLRAHYDSMAFGAGPRAELRRVKTAADLRAEGHFLTLATRAGAAPGQLDLAAALVWLFSAAGARSGSEGGSFSLGRYLRDELFPDVSQDELATRARRFRQVLAARDDAERLHHLRRLIAHAFQRNRHAVDWGVVARDLAMSDDFIRRRWAESFFYRFESTPNNLQEATHV